VPQELDGDTILITGGTGSLGQTLLRRILQGDLGMPAKIIVFSRDEAKQHALKASWKHAAAATEEILYDNFEELIELRIGDVRDYESLFDAVRRADVIFHCAAMKQVPTCEYFPAEAAATNVTGAHNLVRAVRNSGRPRAVVGTSTDKACKPINVMGMTKAIQERILVEGNLEQDHCRLVAARYGNVLSSRGSVIPLFEHQIAAGGPVTLTLPEMTRFLLSIDGAAETLFTALRSAQLGEILVPRLPSASIKDVAEAMIGEREIEIVVTGIRPGEKVHELLVSDEEATRTVERDGHLAIKPQLPELQGPGEQPALDREYSSADAVVGNGELRALLTDGHFVDAAMSGGSTEPTRKR
jgi:FlaA1/EpsC-like NDP-sugar epimerase